MSKTHPIQRMLFFLILAWACAACDLQQDISFDEAADVPPEGLTVSVVWEENEPDGIEVLLNTLDKVVVEEGTVWLLWDIVLAAGLEEQKILSMRFDFEGEDGFRPSSRPGCDLRPGGDLALMYLDYLDPDGLTILWDDSLGLPPCYSVKKLAKILGEPGS